MAFRFLLVSLLGLLASGCASMLPTGNTTTVSRWKTFDEALADFDKITPGMTTVAELRDLGYDPYVTSNVKILNYLDLQNRFFINPSIRKEDLQDNVRDALDAKDRTQGYELDLIALDNKRHGNLFLDMAGFRKRSQETGWTFRALIVLKDGQVVYKLCSGAPHVDRDVNTRKPLGPLQDVEGLLIGGARRGF